MGNDGRSRRERERLFYLSTVSHGSRAAKSSSGGWIGRIGTWHTNTRDLTLYRLLCSKEKNIKLPFGVD